MRILGIDSSGLVATVAVVEDDTLLAEYTVNYKKTHSQTLLPMVDEIVNMLEMDLDTVDAVAVASGPGSFTGLRIGSATAKGLGLALGKPLIEIPTLEGLAYNVYGADGLVCPMMDARRGQVYTGLYAFENDRLQIVEKQQAADVETWIAKVNEMGKRVIFLGDGVPVYKEKIQKGMCQAYAFAPAHMNKQRAGAVAALGLLYFEQGKTVSAREHQPEYLRLSQAERERAMKERDEKEQAGKGEPC